MISGLSGGNLANELKTEWQGIPRPSAFIAWRVFFQELWFALAGIAEGVVAGLVQKGVEKIASRKNLTSQDLTVLLLHEESRSIARLENATKSIASELKELRKEIVPLLL
jgi:hypothetical protein